MDEDNLKGYILYGSNYTTFWKSQNYVDSKKSSGCQGVAGAGRGIKKRDFFLNDHILVLFFFFFLLLFIVSEEVADEILILTRSLRKSVDLGQGHLKTK